jgi:uncharacterized protein YcbK (DUF882 family)
MLSMQELLGKYKLEDQSQEIQDSLKVLLDRVNVIRIGWGMPMTVTSGLRTMEDHLRIYREKAAKAGVPFDESKVPMHSKHLFGQAVDIYDPNRALQNWCKVNEAALEQAQLWMEDFSTTPNWCHFQICPPKSGKRWFMP